MKKFSIALAAAGLAASLGAYAAVPTDAQPFQLVVPNLKSGIEITLEGLLLRPTNDNQQYATTTNTVFAISAANTLLATTSNKNLSQNNPDYNFGFRVGLGYIFPDSGNDVQLGWVHFNHDDDTNTTGNTAGDVIRTGLGVPLFNLGAGITTPNLIDAIPALNIVNLVNGNPAASSSSDFKYDQVNLDVGQYLDVGTRLRLRMFGGLSYARVENNLDNSYSVGYNITTADPADVPTDNDIVYGENDNFDSKFTGIGPRFGIDSSYHIANCFGLVAHVAGALFVGKVDSSTSQNVTATSFDNLSTTAGTASTTLLDTDVTTSTDNQWRVVPAFDAKLGLDYTYIAQNQSMFTVEAGYQWTQFIDAVDRLNNNALGTVTKTTSSVGFDGPYLTLNYKM